MSAGTKAQNFQHKRSIERCVWQDKKDFTVEVLMNSQNSRVYGTKKFSIEDNRLFHHTNKQSKKVKVSACVTWNGATKPFFTNETRIEGLKVNQQT